ncbi:MAG: NUDIX hydrolase [SAR202 cluster bacterium]|nr:NUDIX hydrolase [SAR202 cluster bacterium]MDP6665599.1 NUDIX hydrolase [SAR202 cluster bacterium]MQG57709.1 NUDIX hydrolase [SAR202 cluster bacterium]|tara:strand:- start:3312 stop:3845 length:534 start_codon:yes stop_codon:yes gene_type:complete
MTQEPQLIRQEKKFDGAIVNLRVDTVLLPNGREATFEVVEHEKAVVIVPIDADDNVLLVRQYRHPIGGTLLEAPAGMLNPPESPDDCAQRELREEIGYASRNLRPLGGFWSSPGFCTEFIYAYLARDLVESKLEADEDEDIEVQRTPIDRIPQLIRFGEIQDVKTIATLLMTMHLFK